MMSKLEHALELAEQGFHVFPLIENGKFPLIDQWQIKACRDPEQIKKWWTCPVLDIEQPFNIGICTTRFGDDKGLIVIDVDNKNGKCGDDVLLDIILDGADIPDTLEQITPTGGRHLIYIADEPVKQGVNVLGSGLDIRSKGGFIVGPGSTTKDGEYKWKS